MTFIKLEDVERAVGPIIARIAAINDNAGAYARSIPQALRSLPTDDGWEDIATYEGPENEYIQVWCECEDSGMRWTTAAHRLGNGQWFNDLEGYIPVKGYRPLPAPPSE